MKFFDERILGNAFEDAEWAYRLKKIILILYKLMLKFYIMRLVEIL